jgi:hypothetical protein
VSLPHRPLRLLLGCWLLAGACTALSGCHSRYVEATIVNQGPIVHVLEFDYPNASFGANQLASGARYSYRFKVQANGPVSLTYEDASGKSRTFTGPEVKQGDQGSLLVNIDPAGQVSWKTKVSPPQ